MLRGTVTVTAPGQLPPRPSARKAIRYTRPLPVPDRSARTSTLSRWITASGLVSPSPSSLTRSSWVTPVITMDTPSASGSVTPWMLTRTSLWSGGQRIAGLAWASRHDGGSFVDRTVTVTSSGSLATSPSATTSRNTSVAPPGPTSGAVNVGYAAFASDSATAGPATCFHAYVNASASGSELAEPSRVTALPASIV